MHNGSAKWASMTEGQTRKYLKVTAVCDPHLQSERQRSPGHEHGANSAKEIDKMHLPNSPNDLLCLSHPESRPGSLDEHTAYFSKT